MVGSPLPRRNSMTSVSASQNAKSPTPSLFKSSSEYNSERMYEEKARVYAVFEEFLLRDPEAWKELYAKSLDLDEEKALVTALANLCFNHELGSSFITQYIVPHEIQKTVSTALLLRGDSFTNKLLVEYGRLVAGKFFRKALKQVIQRLVSKNLNCEVDPNRIESKKELQFSPSLPLLTRSATPHETSNTLMPVSRQGSSSSPSLLTDAESCQSIVIEPEQFLRSPQQPRQRRGSKCVLGDLQSDLDHNRERLLTTALSIAGTLTESIKEYPIANNFRALCIAVHEESQLRFPDSGYTGMSGLLFLRYICPYIVSPQQFGLLPRDYTIKPTTQRSLVLVAKLLQVAATQSSFDGEKEVYMVPFNARIKDFHQIISFYENILNDNSPPSKKDKKSNQKNIDPSRIFYTEVLFKSLLISTGISEEYKSVTSHTPTDPLRSVLSFVQEGLLLRQPKVDLSGLGLTQKEATALAKKLQGNDTITELNLSDNSIGSEGIKSLAQSVLAQNKSIIKLDLRKNHFSSDDILHISKSLKSNTTLQELLLDVDPQNPDAEPLWLSIEAITKANRESEKKTSTSKRNRIASFTKSVLNSL